MPEATVDRWVRAKQSQLEERGFSPDVASKAIQIRRALILALHRKSGRVLLGSDAPQIFNVPGFSVHHELEFLVASGLTPFEALHAGTASVAEFLGLNTGAIANGRDADLVLLDDNPIDDIRNARRIHGVMVRGEWFPADDLESMLDRFRATDGS